MALTVPEALKEADLAIRNAQEVRSFHRKKSSRDDHQRQNDIELAIERIRSAMKPLRSEIGRFVHQPASPIVLERQEKIRAASKALQRERRKLWKMLNRSIERTP